ncbi:MAG TPA: preprotein translocase subunit SecE, partial [Novosphingobium sp.]|nr:preprotein translocase subunit SecE [Novosphingobium sp.]
MAKFNPGEFMRQVQTEARKVVWPSRKETTTTAIFVA